MSNADRFTILISALGLLMTALSTLVVLVWRASRAWADTKGQVTRAATDLGDLTRANDADHARLAATLQQVTDKLDARVRWLETNLWNGRARHRH